jgi:hypothetical protein
MINIIRTPLINGSAIFNGAYSTHKFCCGRYGNTSLNKRKYADRRDLKSTMVRRNDIFIVLPVWYLMRTLRILT